MKRHLLSERTAYFLTALSIYVVLFGGIIISGWISGVEWSDYWIDFSWNMLNTEELKDIVLLKE
ncbi:hypothetical protein [Halobacillus litoralis]|uniref:Uncharacterized protein n=1 Tax=Halobacillus litoralis TaxID=45668 RepID=A0A410MA42_9BACI|nr:hypothetical protein [Halobacillus litoralis]QAS51567.1 hypothetical protein HLI_04670 [Halobacillus litoralis]